MCAFDEYDFALSTTTKVDLNKDHSYIAVINTTKPQEKETKAICLFKRHLSRTMQSHTHLKWQAGVSDYCQKSKVTTKNQSAQQQQNGSGIKRQITNTENELVLT